MENKTIHKIGAAIIKDRKLLVCRKKDLWISPGGKVELGETDEECLRRELMEEIQVEVKSFKFLGKYQDRFIPDPSKMIIIDYYIVEIIGNPVASKEIDEIKFVSSKDELHYGSGIPKFMFPELIKLGLID